MSTTKFEREEIALYQGREVKIKVSKKDFGTKEISYRLYAFDGKGNGGVVSEDELEKIPKKPDPTIDTELVELTRMYGDIFAKPVPNNRKKNKKWIEAKIEEFKKAERERIEKEEEEKRKAFKKQRESEVKKEITPPTKEDVEKALAALDKEALLDLISEKELDIDPNDYESAQDLREAILEEWEIIINSELS